MTKPAPKMPENLPALPMGKNGKPLVYLGMGQTFKGYRFIGWICMDLYKWEKGDYNGQSPNHYAAESNSEVCKLNGWGDFAPVDKSIFGPVEKVEIVNGPVEIVPRKTALEIYQESARTALDEAAKECERLASALHDWTVYRDDLALAVRMMGGEQDSTINRRQWYDAGRKDERHHAKVRTVFPVHP